MEKMVWLDCDGTWIDLYGVEGWLQDLINLNERPYVIAKPLVNLSQLARAIHKLQANGWQVGIISWLSKDSNDDFDARVTNAKLGWFAKHLPSVQFDSIHIVPYGEPKSHFGNGYLFDDEERNRLEWKGIALDEKNLIQKLRELAC